MKIPLYLLLLLALFGCREKDEFQENLIGTWKLAELCKPVSQSACDKITVPSDKGVFIAFSTKNEFREFYQNTKPIEYAFLGCGGGSYQTEGQDLRIRAVRMSSLDGRLVKVVSLTPGRLVMNPYGTGEYVFEKQ